MYRPIQLPDIPRKKYYTALKTYQEFVEKYPRATEIVENIYEIANDFPIMWCALRTKRWKLYKAAVKLFYQRFEKHYTSVKDNTEVLITCIVEFRCEVKELFFVKFKSVLSIDMAYHNML